MTNAEGLYTVLDRMTFTEILVCAPDARSAELSEGLSSALGRPVTTARQWSAQLLTGRPQVVVLTEETLDAADEVAASVHALPVAVVDHPDVVSSHPIAFSVIHKHGWATALAERIHRLEEIWQLARTTPNPPPDDASEHPGPLQFLDPGVVLLVDQRGRILWCDAAGSVTPEAWVCRPRSIWQVIPDEERQRLSELLLSVFEQGAPVTGRPFRLQVGGDGDRWALVDAYPYPARGERPELAVLAIRELGSLLRSLRRAEKWAAWQAAALEATRELANCQRVHSCAEHAATITATLLDAEAVAVYVATAPDTDGRLRLMAHRLPGQWNAKYRDWMAAAWVTNPDATPETRTIQAAEALQSGGEEAHWLISGGRQRSGGLPVILLAGRREPWTEEEIHFLGSWAETISSQMALAHSHETTQRQLALHRRVLTAALLLQKTEPLDRVLTLVARFALETVHGQWSYVHLLSADGRRFERLFGPVTAPGVEAPTPLPPRPEGVSWQAVHTRAIVEARRGEIDGPRLREESISSGIAHTVAVPLMTGNDAQGVLVVDRSIDQPLTDLQRETLQAFAAHAAYAVEAAKLHEMLAISEAHYRVLFERNAAAVAVIDRDGWIVLINRRFEEVIGYSREELEGRLKALVLTAPEEWRRIEDYRRRRQAGDPTLPETYEFDYVRKDGQRRRARMSIAVVPETGEHILTLVDVTRERLLQRQLVQVEKAAALGQLVAGVAHELNNPLGIIMGSAELAMASDTREETKAHLERIVQQCHRCKRIIQNLLVFARETQAERIPIDVNAVVEQTVRMHQYQMTVDNVTVELDLAAEVPYVEGDPARLQQVLFNLTINAYQAMQPQGGGKLTISTSASRDTVRIVVADTGPGISPEHLPRIFDPFFTTKPPGEGTGMGLSVCMGIVQDMGGRIWAESQPRQGARFIIELPAAQFGRERPAQQPAQPDRVETPASGKGARILVIDDESGVRDVIASALQARGHKVTAVTDADAAMQAMEAGEFGCILCDLRLPGMSGARFHALVSQRWPAMADRFVFITGDTVSQESRQFLERTNCPALQKPFRLPQLYRVVDETIKRSQSK